MPTSGPSLLRKVRSKLFIHSNLRSIHHIEGSHPSLQHGRAHDFDDLRQYQMGDNARDIDWRATARLGEPVIKRSRIPRMHTVIFIVDTGRRMRAIAPSGVPKKELAILSVGVLGDLAQRYGDSVALFAGSAAGTKRLPPTRSEGGLEFLLRTVNTMIEEGAGSSDLDTLLRQTIRAISSRAVVVIVTDESPFTPETEDLIKRLQVQHDLLWVTIADADPIRSVRGGPTFADVDTNWVVPDFAQSDEALIAELHELDLADTRFRAAALRNRNIADVVVSEPQAGITELLRMLNRRAHARR